MRCVAGWIVGAAALAVLAGAALEVEGQSRELFARQSLRTALEQAERSVGDPDERRTLEEVRRGPMRGWQDAITAQRLAEHAEAHPSAEAWRWASLAITWDGGREAEAAQAARRAARLAPSDPAYAAFADAALDAATWAEVRALTRPVGLLGAGLLSLGLLRWLASRAHARRRRAWLALARVRVAASADGHPAAPGADLAVPQGTRNLVLDVFLTPPPPTHGRRAGPTLSLALGHGRDSRTLRLTPVKDVRQDAVRVRLTESTLAEVLGRPGRWRVAVALDGRPLGEAGLCVAAPRAAFAAVG